MSLIVLLLAATGLLSASCAMIQRTAPVLLSDDKLLSIMNTANRSDIEGGRLAEERGEYPQVRDFGHNMVADHSVMLTDTKRLAHRLNVEPLSSALNKKLIERHQAALDRLSMKSGREFDRAYLDHEIQTHEHLISLVDKAAYAADHVALKELLRQAKPALQAHLDSARAIRTLLAVQPD
jgi:putative membrane protein